MHCDVDKPLDYNEKSVQLYHAIHEYSEAGYSKRAISKMLHCSRNTVTKYLEGDYDSLCRKNFYSQAIAEDVSNQLKALGIQYDSSGKYLWWYVKYSES